jgi:RNA polymerase sigma-70 factor (ECF subfamily)
MLVERHLATAAAAVDTPYLSLVFERHYRFVVAAVCRITGRFDMAQDLAQEVFVKVLRNIAGFRSDAKFTTWLYAIARNCCYDYAKACAARPRELGEETLAESPAVVENDALRSLHIDDARRIVHRLIVDARLDETERRVFTLHYGADIPLDALSDRLGLRNRSGAKASIVSAKRKLGKALARWRQRRRSQGSMMPWRMA